MQQEKWILHVYLSQHSMLTSLNNTHRDLMSRVNCKSLKSHSFR